MPILQMMPSILWYIWGMKTKNSDLTALQKQVCFEKGTERPFSGEYWDHFKQGEYHCINCHEPLFLSDDKFDAGCGWPSFSLPIDKDNIREEVDERYGMRRVEIQCQNCGAHLGHVFDDGPEPSGLRYCVNSASLDFKKK